MNALIHWFVRNKIAANLIMLLVLVAGILSLPQIRKEFLPEHSLNSISITVAYPGATPPEVERLIVLPIETAIQNVRGIHSVQSFAAESFASLIVEVGYGENSRRVFDDIKERIDALILPVEARKPVIEDNDLRGGVLKVMVSGPADEATLRQIAGQLRLQLIDAPEISQVELTDVRPQFIVIDLDEQRLRQYGLMYLEVVNAVRMASVEFPGGVVLTREGAINVRTLAQTQQLADYESIVLRASPDGSRIILGDVARIERTFMGNAMVRFNGQPAVSLSVFRVGQEDIMATAKAIDREIANPRFYMPEGVRLDIWQNVARLVQSRIELLSVNALGGLVLVFGLLLLFFRPALAFWVAFGIPVSFLGAMTLMPYLGVSLNMISLFAYILVLGIVVDDAIVVGESISLEAQTLGFGERSSLRGTLRVAIPVIFSTATTLIAFFPLLFMGGVQGRLVRDIPIVVIAVLSISLLESLLILPAHLADVSPRERFRFQKAIQDGVNRLLNAFVARVYTPVLDVVLRRRGMCLAVFIVCYLVTAGVSIGGWLGSMSSSDIESDYVTINVVVPFGSLPEVLVEQIAAIERKIQETQRTLEQETGEKLIDGIYSFAGVMSQDHLGTVVIGMTPNEKRQFRAEDLVAVLRQKMAQRATGVDVYFQSGHFQGRGLFVFSLTGHSSEVLAEASARVRERLGAFAGVYNIIDDMQRGRQEVMLSIKPAARDLGLNENELALQIRQMFFGMELQSVHIDNELVRVFIRFSQLERDSLWNLENGLVRLPLGDMVPLMTVADVHLVEGPDLIKRVDGKRVVNIIAETDLKGKEAEGVISMLLTEFQNEMAPDYPGVVLEVGGQIKAQQGYQNYLVKSAILSLLGMYILIAILYRSYVQPLLILIAVPFGQIGALLGHLLLGIELSVWSIVGVVAVSGVVVNDNLVLIDMINRLRREGLPLVAAIHQAAAIRFRPIILTSLTTFAGLVPLLLERSWQAQFLKPMAVSLAFGVLFATLLTLFLVPALKMLFDDWGIFLRKIWGSLVTAPDDAPPVIKE